jgi:hypothetical protein
MSQQSVRKAPLSWWLGGLLLGLTQMLAVGVKKPLGVSTQFVVADSLAIHQIAPEYASSHDVIGKEKYQTLGYGWWLDVGLILGAAGAALACRRWRVQVNPVWSRVNGHGVLKRLIVGFVGGFLILLGARFAHGCTSGQFASGWAQLSLSVLPFTATMFGFGLLAAWLMYPKAPEIER